MTLDPDLAQMIDEEVHRRRTTFKQVVNEALRRGLAQPTPGRRKHRAPSFHAELAPGIDPHSMNRLAGDLETDAVRAKGRR